MKLTKTINIETYEVLSNYKVKVKQSPFIAILKFAEENGKYITVEKLYDFLYPLSKKACENILNRLTNMGYFDEKDYYYLTELGCEAAKQEVFYEERKGMLRVYFANNEFIEQKIVKIEELNRKEDFDDSSLSNINRTFLNNLDLKQKITLENGIYILDTLEKKCRELKRAQEQLVFETTKDYCSVRLLEFIGNFKNKEDEVRHHMLKQEFNENYLEERETIKTEFDPQNLQLQRDIKIENPRISNTSFDAITVKSVKHSPMNLDDAQKWFKALVTERINKYFLSEEEFNQFANKISEDFDLYKTELIPFRF